MKQLKKELLAVAKDLKKLTQKTEKMAKELERLGKTQAAKKSKAKENYACTVCGLLITVNNVCNCVEACDIVCCNEPMRKKR